MAVAAGAAAGSAGAAGGASGGSGFDPKMIQQFGGMMGGSNQGGNNGGSQGNFMTDNLKAQSDTWTQYIDSTQAPQQQALPQKTPQANQAPAQQPAVDNKPTIMKYIEASNRAAELKKQQEANNVDLSRYAE